jgi:hypothetical protein
MTEQLTMAGKAEGELNISLNELLALENEMHALLAQCEEPEDTDAAAILNDEIIGSVKQSISEKLRRYQRFFAFCDMHAQSCADEIERLRKRKQTIENAKNRLRRYLAGAMDAWQIKRLDAGTCVFVLMPGRPSLEITDAGKIPYAFQEERIVTEINKPALKLALEQGEEVEGARLAIGDPFVAVK